MPGTNITCIKTLAYNLRFIRAERGLTQDQVAQSAGLSHRAYQQLESGSGNPSLESLDRLSRFLKIEVSSLLRLNRVRIPIPNQDEFVASLKSALNQAKIICHFRADVKTLWVSEEAEKFYGRSDLPGTATVYENLLRPALQTLLRSQVDCEARGYVQPYQSLFPYPDGREIVLRLYPTLVYPFRGTIPAFAVVYAVDAAQDCDQKYFEFTGVLIEALKAGGWVEKVV